MTKTGYNMGVRKSAAARRLGISRRRVYRDLERADGVQQRHRLSPRVEEMLVKVTPGRPVAVSKMKSGRSMDTGAVQSHSPLHPGQMPPG